MRAVAALFCGLRRPFTSQVLTRTCLLEKMASVKLSEFTQKAVMVFKECAHVPSLSRARSFRRSGGEGGCFEVEATWTLREMERGKKVSYTKSYFVQRKGCALEKLCGSAFQSDATQM